MMFQENRKQQIIFTIIMSNLIILNLNELNILKQNELMDKNENLICLTYNKLILFPSTESKRNIIK